MQVNQVLGLACEFPLRLTAFIQNFKEHSLNHSLDFEIFEICNKIQLIFSQVISDIITCHKM